MKTGPITSRAGLDDVIRTYCVCELWWCGWGGCQNCQVELGYSTRALRTNHTCAIHNSTARVTNIPDNTVVDTANLLGQYVYSRSQQRRALRSVISSSTLSPVFVSAKASKAANIPLEKFANVLQVLVKISFRRITDTTVSCTGSPWCWSAEAVDAVSGSVY
jgi:hypothetical protein